MLCTHDKSTLFILWDNYITQDAQQLVHLAEYSEKRLYINTLISFYQFMHDMSMGYPYIFHQAPIFCMNTQKSHTKIGKKSRALLLSSLNSPTSRAFSFLSLSPPDYPFFRQNILRRPTNDTLALARSPLPNRASNVLLPSLVFSTTSCNLAMSSSYCCICCL